MDKKEREHQEQLLEQYRRRLGKLEQQAARKGYSTPPEVLTEIEDIKAKIESIREALGAASAKATTHNQPSSPPPVVSRANPFTLSEWLKRVGFQKGNPFARKQADEKDDLRQEYFVEHPAYNALLDLDQPCSSVLHARRGAGKSTARCMFQDYCTDRATECRLLIVPMLDWVLLKERVGALPTIETHHLIEELFQRVVKALAEDTQASWLVAPHDPDTSAYLNWMCLSYTHYLMPSQRGRLEQRGWIVEQDVEQLAPYSMKWMGSLQQVKILISILRMIGYQTCFVVVDRIDELPNEEDGAAMVEKLRGNLPPNQVPDLVFKYFIPTEVVEVLRQRGKLREDLLKIIELSWGGTGGRKLLRDLLRKRLEAFSDNQIHSLAEIATPNMRQIDDMLIAAAQESPRRLLILGDTLFHICANNSEQNHLLIEQEYLDMTLQFTVSL